MLIHNCIVDYFITSLATLGKCFRVYLECFFLSDVGYLPYFHFVLQFQYITEMPWSQNLLIHKNSRNIEPYNIDDVTLVSRLGICTIKKGNLSLLSKSLCTNILPLIIMSKYKNVACSPWCSSFSSNCWRQLFFKCFCEP